MTALADKTLEVLADMPPYLADDPSVQTAEDALARELQRLDDYLQALLNGAFPARSNDEYGLLAIWEATFGLPVQPVGVALQARRDRVTAAFRKRKVSSGENWIDTLTEAMGTSVWSHYEGPADYTVTITVPFHPASDEYLRVEALAREITPAHLDIVMSSTEGFILGVSQLGDAL